MNKAHKNRIVSPIIISLFVVITFLSVAIINNLLTGSLLSENQNYVKSIIKEPTQSVYGEVNKNVEEVETTVFMKPYLSDDVEVSASYYSKDDSKENQEASIIKYDNTYLPSTGVLYTSEDTFDVVAVYDGTVMDIKDDNLLGKSVVIKHTDGLTCYYYSLKDINLSVGDIVKQGQVIGKSSNNKISSSENNLLFETSYEDHLINPEEIFNKAIGNFS